MLTLTLKNLAAHRRRLLATAFAVLLGVAFMSGTLIFTDTVDATFDSALAEANEDVDAYVRVPSELELGYGDPGPRLDSALAAAVARVPEVDEVALRINGYAQLVDRHGEPVGDVSKSPAFGTNWTPVDDLNPYELASGRAPSSPDEVVVDVASADAAGYAPGDVATVLTKGAPRELTISGTARFGTSDSPAGATAVLFTDDVAAELLGEPGQADGIALTGDEGVSQAALVHAVQTAVGDDVEVITGDELVAGDQAALSEATSMFRMIMVTFGVISVLVGAFIINNTFAITVAQRSRELAMLRALGASGRQVRRSVLTEAAVIGALGSAAGLAVGRGVSSGLRWLMEVGGFPPPEGATVVTTRAVVISLAVGVVVTVLSAWLPSRRAARIAPIAALREVDIDASAASGRRAVAGAVVVAAGVAALLAGLSLGDVAVVGAGALTTVIGVSVLGPVLARPLGRAIGAPLRLRGVTGELATQNAMRNPKRTARTAASLMIGVGLVGFITVFAASAKTSVSGSMEADFTGTHIVQTGSTSNAAGLSPTLADSLRTTPGVDVVAQARISPAIVDGVEDPELSAFDARRIGEIFRLGDVDGDLAGLGPDGLAVSADRAEDDGLAIGSTVPVTFPTGPSTFVVRAIYEGSTDWVGQHFVDLEAFRAAGMGELDHRVYVAGDEEAIRAAASGHESAEVLDEDGFLDLVNAEVDTMLGLFYAMLGLAVVIALFGIANTLSLSTFERTRELGLLRAIGMGRSQLRSTVRWEAVIIAVFGAAMGLAVGTFFGWAVVRAMADEGIDTLTIPVGNLIVVTALAALAAAMAAVLPARRAGRLDVLEAVATA